MIFPIQVQVVRGMVKNGCSDKEIKSYIDKIILFNLSKHGKEVLSELSECKGHSIIAKNKGEKWIVTILDE